VTIVGGVDHDIFTRRYLAQAGPILPESNAEELTGLAESALSFGSVRRPGEILVRVQACPSGAALDIVTADVAYLVDSVRAELARAGYSSLQVLHPQLVVTRDPDGRIARIHDLDDTADVPAGALVESWMHVRFSEPADAAALDALAVDIRRVLTDVQHAGDDLASMLAAIAALADLTAQSRSVTTADLNDILAAGVVMVSPYPTDTLGERIASISMDSGGVVKTDWIASRNWTAGGQPTVPAGYLQPNESVIVAHVTYRHRALFGFALLALMLLVDARRGARVVR